MILRSVLISAFFSCSAWAASTNTGLHDVGVNLSIEPGGLAIGADYQYMGFKKDLGIGGYFHYFSKSTDSSHPANGAFMLGAEAAAHYVSGPLDAYIVPGFGFVSINTDRSGGNNAFTLGPKMGFGILYQINPSIALGAEENAYFVWFDSDYNGQVVNDLAFKFRGTF